jgi:hypothetical protein
MKRTSLVLAGGLLLIAGALTSSAAQTPAPQNTRTDARWSSWLGCWELSDESVDDGSVAIARLLGVPAPRSRENAGARVCVTPAAEGGATMTTYVNDRAVLSESIVPDGTSRPITEAECRGEQRAEWSTLGARVYASAEITCQSEPARRVSGLAMMVAGPTWLDIQTIESNGGKTLRVRRYHRAADQKRAGEVPAPATAATMPLGRSLSIADEKEASQKVSAEVVQAALVELRSGFDLNGKRLVELEDANVPRGVIDLMVALSFPKRFVVERPVARSSGGGGSWWTPMGYGDYDDLWPYYAMPYAYSPFYSSYYAPFGYRYWGYFDPFYYSGPGYVVIDPGGGNGSPRPQPSGEGRVVDGHGYTRVRRSDPEPAMPRTGRSGDGSSTTSSGQSTDTGSSSGGVSSSGYSGGSSGSGDRTAQPRPPGGR